MADYFVILNSNHDDPIIIQFKSLRGDLIKAKSRKKTILTLNSFLAVRKKGLSASRLLPPPGNNNPFIEANFCRNHDQQRHEYLL